ncbi:MAG: alpha/beta hydrolase [Rhodospirillales bacterium]
MPELSIQPDTTIHYVIDDFSWPWETPETVLCVPGLAECNEVWAPWVPYLARAARILRMDQRGMGASSAMPEDYPWSLDGLADDVAALIGKEAPKGAHLIGAKIAGPVVVRTATRHPALVKSLVLVGMPIKGPSEPGWSALLEAEGVRGWAAAPMDARLAGMSTAAKEWWADMMARTPVSTLRGFLPFLERIDVGDDLEKIACPTLVISSDSPRRPIDATRAWQEKIPGSTLAVVPGDGHHAAATQAVECAVLAAGFIGGLIDVPSA